MDLVAVDAAAVPNDRPLTGDLVDGQGRRHVQQRKARDVATLEHRRVAQLAAQDLEPAAHAQDHRARGGGSYDFVGQALGPQVAQASRRVRAAGQDDRVIAGQRRARPDRRDRDAGRVEERIELVEVAGIGEDEQSDVDPTRDRLATVMERVLFGQGVATHRDDRHGRDAGPLLEQLHGVAEQRRVASELVEDEATDERPLRGLEALPGPEQMRERAAPIDVGNEVDVGSRPRARPPC